MVPECSQEAAVAMRTLRYQQRLVVGCRGHRRLWRPGSCEIEIVPGKRVCPRASRRHTVPPDAWPVPLGVDYDEKIAVFSMTLVVSPDDNFAG